MASTVEKSLMDEFLNELRPKTVCDIARSVYQGGSIRLLSPEDAKVLLMALPYSTILMCNKVPITALVKFLYKKGLTSSTSGLKRSDFCLIFKALIEINESIDNRPSV